MISLLELKHLLQKEENRPTRMTRGCFEGDVVILLSKIRLSVLIDLEELGIFRLFWGALLWPGIRPIKGWYFPFLIVCCSADVMNA